MAHHLTTAYCLFPTHHHLLNTHVNHVANIRSPKLIHGSQLCAILTLSGTTPGA